jgi:hypothetical protein
MACIKPPVATFAGKLAMIGVTGPVFPSGPKAPLSTSTPPTQSASRTSTTVARVDGAGDFQMHSERAERAIADASNLSLDKIVDAKKNAQRSLSEARRKGAAPASITKLEAAVKGLQRQESKKRSELLIVEATSAIGVDQVAPAVWISDYLSAVAEEREIVEVIRDGFTYLYDSTPSTVSNGADNRPVAVFGKSGESQGPRDRSRMSGYPNPNHVDRGHLIGLSFGGGNDLNLIPQDPALNRGISDSGKAWRQIERYLTKNPGTEFFVRPTYGDGSDFPSLIEYGLQLSNGEWRSGTFTNPRSSDC